MQGRSGGQQPGTLRETAGVDSETTEQLQRVGDLGPQPGVADLGETRVRLLFRGDAVVPVQPGQEDPARPGQCRAELLAAGQRLLAAARAPVWSPARRARVAPSRIIRAPSGGSLLVSRSSPREHKAGAA